MGFLDWLKTTLSIGAADNRPLDFPPAHLKREWDEIEGYVLRYENDRAELLKRDAEFGGPRASDEKKDLFTPVPLAAEMARLSSQLLFSAEPKFVNEQQEKVTERVVEANDPGEFFLDAGEHVAVQGYGGLRVIRDEEVSDVPLVTHVAANRCVFRVRHGRFVTGGYVVIERRPDPFRDEVWRLVEDHKGTSGRIERALYRGNKTSLGREVAHAGWLEEFSGLAESTDTRMDAPTLYRWNNVPGGWSDLARLDSLFDLLNEAESTGKEKLRKSVPIVFADRTLADRQGVVNTRGVVLTGSNVRKAGDEGLVKSVEVVERELAAESHKLYVSHLRDSILMYGGYSLASWGLDDGGSADSGKALRLRQQRTLLTKAGKERSARAAITAAFAAACCWSENARDPKPFRPDLQLGDGLPRDPVEDAQVVATLKSAELISDEQGLRFLHPEWSQKQVDEELERLEEEREKSAPPAFSVGGFNAPPRDDPSEAPGEDGS